LPETFGRNDCKEILGNGNLMFNTGLLLIRLKNVDPVKCCFKMVDAIVKTDLRYDVANLPEDWVFSTQCMKSGVNYACTREINITHTGVQMWGNQK